MSIDPTPGHAVPIESLATLPGIEKLRSALGPTPAYLVGGAVRDLLLGLEVADLDVVVEGDPGKAAAALGGTVRSYERFSTATAEVDGHRVDLAQARTEIYPYPGALPEVRPAGIAEDLGRRDFTVNAMAIPLSGGPLLDPHAGRADLDERRLRVLHVGSFSDDPTRALRGARYAARLHLIPDPLTESLLEEADLGLVSTDRIETELARIAAERSAAAAFRLAARWGLLPLGPEALDLIESTADLALESPWRELGDRADAILGAADPASPALNAASARPATPLEKVKLAQALPAGELVIARAAGAEWAEEYVRTLSAIKLEITGADLLSAGVPEGPAIGTALDAALAAKLEGQAPDRAMELTAALRAVVGR